MGGEQVAGFNRLQAEMVAVPSRHRGHDAHLHAEGDILLDHIRIHRGQHDVGRHAGLPEGLVDMAAAGEADVIRDERIRRQVREGYPLAPGQSMSLGHHDHMVPFVAWKRHQVVELGQTFGGDPDIGLARQNQTNTFAVTYAFFLVMLKNLSTII